MESNYVSYSRYGQVGTPDAVTPVRPVSRTGDVWLLGRHRLICGDSTKAETVQKLMGSAGKSSLAALSFTSPPYGNQRDYTAGIDDWDSLMRGVYAHAHLKH